MDIGYVFFHRKRNGKWRRDSHRSTNLAYDVAPSNKNQREDSDTQERTNGKCIGGERECCNERDHDRLPYCRHVKARWRYDWGLNGKSEPDCEFIPMAKGTPHFKPQFFEHLKTLKSAGFHSLLGYNEPERESQGNLSLETAKVLNGLLRAFRKT